MSKRPYGFAFGILAALTALLLMAPSGGLPSRPTFQTVRTLAARTNATAPYTAQSTSPAYRWIKTDAAAGEGRWEISTSGTQQLFRTLDDTGAAIENWLTVTRVGTDATNISFTPIVNGTNAAIAFFASSITPRLYFDDTDAAVDEGTWRCDASGTTFQCSTRTDADGAGNNWIQATRSGTTVSTLNLTATEVQINGLPVSGTGASGTFTASFDTACTTTPTITYDWTRSGNIVVLHAASSSGFPCTGDSTSFVTTAAPVPAAIRPNTNVDSAGYPGYTDNSAGTWANITITSGGNISFNECTSFTASCNGVGWTAALNRAAPTLNSTAYMLGNP